MEINLQNQVALVTGGSRGIGAAAVRLFVRAGARVVFNYRKAASEARRLVQECGGEKRVVAVRADVSRMTDARKLVSAARRCFGGLDVLVANAGIWNAGPAPIESMSEAQWDELMAVNLKGVYSVIHYAV